MERVTDCELRRKKSSVPSPLPGNVRRHDIDDDEGTANHPKIRTVIYMSRGGAATASKPRPVIEHGAKQIDPDRRT